MKKKKKKKSNKNDKGSKSSYGQQSYHIAHNKTVSALCLRLVANNKHVGKSSCTNSELINLALQKEQHIYECFP